MDLGRFQVGDFVPLRVRSVAPATGVPTLPSTPVNVYATIYSSAPAVVDQLALPILDRFQVTGQFARQFQLDSDYSAGQYVIQYSWAVSGNFGGDVDTFEVVAGGSASGAVVSAYEMQMPDARYLVHEYDSGSIVQGRNPS